MQTISSHIHRHGRNQWTGAPTYYTGVVVLWRHGAAWVFQRSFALEPEMQAWIAAKRAELKNVRAIEALQAAE